MCAGQPASFSAAIDLQVSDLHNEQSFLLKVGRWEEGQQAVRANYKRWVLAGLGGEQGLGAQQGGAGQAGG